jgi:acyl-CoA synthetase (AMP-forming)/AMP-acid ligase II
MVAYVVANGTSSSVSKIRKSMEKHLPVYMIPEFFIQLANMPLTPNGKVDSGALPVVLKAGDF